MSVIPNLGYEPRHLELREKIFNNCEKKPLFGYLFTVTAYAFEITATILVKIF
jgi:hypothetical protein